MNVTVEFLTFVSALIGGGLSSWVAWYTTNKQMKHNSESWLLNKRSEVYSKFLEVVENCDQQACLLFRETPPDSIMEKNQKLMDIYAPMMIHGQIVMFYMEEDIRGEFHGFLNSYLATQMMKDFNVVTKTWNDTSKWAAQQVRVRENIFKKLAASLRTSFLPLMQIEDLRGLIEKRPDSK